MTTEPVTVRDAVTLLLAKKKIPANDYIHLYDSSPYLISNGHVAAKLPCNEESETDLSILIGKALTWPLQN